MPLYNPADSLLVNRAKLFRDIRAFFAAQNVLEVDTPLLGVTAVTDPHIDSFAVDIKNTEYYLQTSPEFFMKRLLCADCGAIYSLGKVFRQDEIGSRHNPEFTLLEWYRPGFDDKQLMEDVRALVSRISPQTVFTISSYRDLFTHYVGVDPHNASVDELESIARSRLELSWKNETKSTWLDVLFSHFVEPQLNEKFTFVYDYPACQSALAKIALDDYGQRVAKRFEVFWKGFELGNGYWELTDPVEQRERFNADNRVRKNIGKSPVKPDERLLASMMLGMPECAGIAIGVDRLLMCLLNEKKIENVLPFPFASL